MSALAIRSEPSSSRFDLILVGYRADETQKSIDFCDRAFSRRLVRRKILVLNQKTTNDMAAPFSAKNPGTNWEVIAGSNVFAEFSGWQEGLDFLDSGTAPSAGVIFVNDTVVTHRHFTLARRLALTRSIENAPSSALVGFRDQVPGEMSVAGLSLGSWASTFCFALTTEALGRLDRRLYASAVIDQTVRGGVDEATFFAGLSPVLEAHLRNWLFNGVWYAGARLSAENTERLARKARCIIAEKLLSARCEAAGTAAVDPFDDYPVLRFSDKVLRRLARLTTRR